MNAPNAPAAARQSIKSRGSEGAAAEGSSLKKNVPKPYEQMQYPGQHAHIDVEAVPCK